MFARRALKELQIEIARLSGFPQAIATLTQIVSDHETRIRRTEKYMYAIPASLLASGAAVVAAWLARH